MLELFINVYKALKLPKFIKVFHTEVLSCIVLPYVRTCAFFYINI